MSLDSFAPAIFVLLWSTGWMVAKYASMHSDPFTFLVMRYACPRCFRRCFALLPVRMAARLVQRLPRDLFRHLPARVLSRRPLVGDRQGVPAAISGIIAALQPLMTAMAAPYLVGERLQPVQQIGLVLGFVGIAIAISPKLLTSDDRQSLAIGDPARRQSAGMVVGDLRHALSEAAPAERRPPLDRDAAICRRADRDRASGAYVRGPAFRRHARGDPVLSSGRSSACRWARSACCSISSAEDRCRALRR